MKMKMSLFCHKMSIQFQTFLFSSNVDNFEAAEIIYTLFLLPFQGKKAISAQG